MGAVDSESCCLMTYHIWLSESCGAESLELCVCEHYVLLCFSGVKSRLLGSEVHNEEIARSYQSTGGKQQW